MHGRISLLNVGPWFTWSAKFGYILRSVLRDQHDSTKHPVPFSRGTRLTTSLGDQHDPSKTPKPFSREMQGIHLAKKNNMKHKYRQLQQSPLHHSIIWKRLSGATEWNVYSMAFHFCLIHFDRFMNSTLQPLKSPLLNGFWMPEDAFCEISTVWFQQKMTLWHHMINIS